MSDPAFEKVALPQGTLVTDDVPRDPEAVYLFDFDGVIVSGVEDAIYKLPGRPGEENSLLELAERMSIRLGGMETRYQRHLLFQEVAYRTGLAMERGPGFALAAWASANARTFILTARSGWAATARVRRFVEENLHPPIEIYQLGRTSKVLPISLLCAEFSGRPLYYIEDSPAHLANAGELAFDNLHLAHCTAPVPEARVDALYRSAFDRVLENPDTLQTEERHGG